MNGNKIEVDRKTFKALQVILCDEWFACDHPERLKYYEDEAEDFLGKKHARRGARRLREAGVIVDRWLTKNGAKNWAWVLNGRG